MKPIDILEKHNISFVREGQHHHARPGWVQIKTCPFCGSDRYHLGLNLAIVSFSCWKCGGHSAASAWKALGVAIKEIRGLRGERELRRLTERHKLKIPPAVGPMLPPHRRYLEEVRGLDPDEMEEIWGIQGIGIASRLSWRLFVPIQYRGETVSWTTRTIGDKGQRYISASAKEEAMNHKHLIYGQDLCSHSIVIVEGPGDAWRIGPGAGALFGTAFTAPQVRELARHPYRFIAFDSSREAQEKALDLKDQLTVFPGETAVVELDAEDPGSASLKEVARLRRAAGLD